MESVFLACFLFGALFTVASVFLGAVGTGLGGHGAHGGALSGAGHAPTSHAGHGGHLGGTLPNGHAPGLAPGAHGPLLGHGAGTGQGHGAAAAGHGAAAHGDGSTLAQVSGAQPGAASPAPLAPAQHSPLAVLQTLPLLNFSSVVAFLTWFGAAGYGLLHFAAWPLLPALVLALVAGMAGALLIAVFLERLVAGERGEMHASEYRLPGTLARVTVSIPANGVGEILFSKGGVRRSEAARSLTGRPIPRATEVVILRYGRGVAGVQPWAELLAEHGSAPKTGAVPEGQDPGDGPPPPVSDTAAVETPGGPGV